MIPNNRLFSDWAAVASL